MKVVKRIIIVLLCVVLLAALVVGGYVGYLMLQYKRIADYAPLDVLNPQQGVLQPGVEYSASTFNIGFGAYDPAFSFFMDTGEMLDGTPVKGEHARAQSEAIVKSNTQGVIDQVLALNPDFSLFQEVDVDADRSFHINQADSIRSAFPAYASVYASNFHSAFLAYPLNEMHGAVEAGLVSMSRFEIVRAARRSFPVDESFPTKFFDLDRCFSVSRIPVEGGKELVLMNVHMSAYDEGGTIRAQQLAMLGAAMQEEQTKGNWVVVGGDFNHALSNSVDTFKTGQKVPPWVYTFSTEDLPAGFRVVDAANAMEVPTCRSSDMPYQPGVSYTVILDGFIVSDNVNASAQNIDAGFANSDHNPVVLTFSLQGDAAEETPAPEGEPAQEETPAEG